MAMTHSLSPLLPAAHAGSLSSPSPVSRPQTPPVILQVPQTHRRAIVVGLGSALWSWNALNGNEEAMAAARRPPPPPAAEKKDPNVSGVQAKVLASKKRKEAMRASMAKLREKGKPVVVEEEPSSSSSAPVVAEDEQTSSVSDQLYPRKREQRKPFLGCRQGRDGFVDDSRSWNRKIRPEYGFDEDYDGEEEEDDQEEEDRSLDLLLRFVENVFRKVSKKARKAVRSILHVSISTKLVGFSVNGVLILAFLWILKAFPEDKALAALAIEDKKRQFAAVEKYIEEVLQCAL